MHWNALVASLLLALVAFAGCAEKSATAATSLSQAPPATATAETGGIDGIVVDDEQAPIEGANITLRGTVVEVVLSTLSAADGTYSFSMLEAGTYEVTVAAFGFESRVTKVEVIAGEVTRATTALVRIAVVEAMPELLIRKGYINCSVSHASHEGFYSTNPCRAQSNEASQIPWTIDLNRNATEAIIELVWKPGTGGTGERLQLWLCSDKDDTTNYMNCIQFVGPNPYSVRTHGKSPLVMRTVPVKTVSKYEVDVGDGWFETSAPRIPVTLQQSFDAYLTACYGKKCPDDYQGRPPA